MKLVSDFKDYYDGLQAGDLEKKPIYVRKTADTRYAMPDVTRGENVLPDALRPLVQRFLRMPSASVSVTVNLKQSSHVIATAAIVVFCGKAYFGYRWNLKHDGFGPSMLVYNTRTELYDNDASAFEHGVFVTFDELMAAFEAWTPRTSAGQHLREEVLKPKNPSATTYGERLNFNRKGWDSFASAYLPENPVAVPADLHRLSGAPALLVKYEASKESSWRTQILLRTNPDMRALGFQRRIPPALAWQSVDQYLSSEMATQIDPLPLDDKYRRDAHGFDDKSFKQTSPGDRKARRVARRKAEKTT